ncbi:MAG: hypothetical protein JXC36_01525, partial [Candidatus Atribacteria bacterium]|nr:hypothetical protein [Candidatus Atribacteria bacterium]
LFCISKFLMPEAESLKRQQLSRLSPPGFADQPPFPYFQGTNFSVSGAHQYLRSRQCDESELLLGNASQRSAVSGERERILVSAVAFGWGELGVGGLSVE